MDPSRRLHIRRGIVVVRGGFMETANRPRMLVIVVRSVVVLVVSVGMDCTSSNSTTNCASLQPVVARIDLVTAAILVSIAITLVDVLVGCEILRQPLAAQIFSPTNFPHAV